MVQNNSEIMKLFDQPVKSNLITYGNIRKIVTGQGDDYTTGCQLNYNYFNKNYKIIAIDLCNNKHLMLIQKRYSKLFLQEI